MKRHTMNWLGFFLGLSDEYYTQQRRKNYGITNNGYDGVPKVGIPNKYYKITVKENHYYCHRMEKVMDVYTLKGELLFSCSDAHDAGEGYFFVQLVDKDSEPELGYALFKGSKKITEPVYKPINMTTNKFNKAGLIYVRLHDNWSSNIVLNQEGEEMYVDEDAGISSNFHLKGKLVKKKKG
mgnify:CR=1 FL=1